MVGRWNCLLRFGLFGCYGWWKKYCTTWDVYKALSIMVDSPYQLVIAGFLNHQRYVRFREWTRKDQRIFQVLVKDYRQHIITQLAVSHLYTRYVLPSSGLYNPYHLFRRQHSLPESFYEKMGEFFPAQLWVPGALCLHGQTHSALPWWGNHDGLGLGARE